MKTNKNNLFFAIIVIILCTLIAGIFLYDRNNTRNQASEYTQETNTTATNETQQSTEVSSQKNENTTPTQKIPTIYCVGDSTTLGTENQNNSYPTYLSQAINANIKVIGDEKLTSAALLVKLGVTPVYVDKLSIPSTTTPTPIVFLNENGKANNDLLKSQGSIENVTINGISGSITYRYEGNTLLFTRHQAGEASTVNAPTLIQVNNTIEPDSILILYTGTYEESINGSLMNYQKQIINAFNTDKYLVVSLTQDDRNETNQALASTYSNNFLNFRDYLLTNGLKDANIQATAEDLQNLNENKIPPSLLADKINGNDKYSQLLANQIINKLTDLNYLNKNNLK